MRLDGQEKQMQCHSHPVGHGIKCNETQWSRKTMQCHSHTVGHAIKCNETGC